MELHPTPQSWRVALFTAIGAGAVGAGAVVLARSDVGPWWFWWAVVVAALATFGPAVGAMSASVEADERGVTVRRFGNGHSFAWPEIASITVKQRRARVPDGTEYHWLVPGRSAHVVAVPCLQLADGRVRELPALSAPATAAGTAVAQDYVARLARILTPV